MKEEIKAVLINGIMYKIGNTNVEVEFVYGLPSPKVEQIIQLNDISVCVNLSNKAFVLIPVNNSTIFYNLNEKETDYEEEKLRHHYNGDNR